MNKPPLSAKTKLEKLLLRQAPEGYPDGYPIDHLTGFPIMRFIGAESAPQQLIAFDDLSRAAGFESVSGVMFFKQDYKFASHLFQPLRYLNAFQEFKCVLTPDISITSGMERFERDNNIRLARQFGVVLQEHGMSVIVNVRWADSNDYEIVTRGIPTGSVIAVSNYGLYKYPDQVFEFNKGLPVILEILKPQLLVFYGTLDPWLSNQISNKTEVRVIPPNVWAKKSLAENAGTVTFEFE